jgi:lipid II:glycine glycyltransferase (peptidoglycan interpeptide bridge formation enzyme)
MWRLYKDDPLRWDQFVSNAGGSVYQSSAWGRHQEDIGKRVLYLYRESNGLIVATALLIVREKLGVLVCWAPSGPIITTEEELKSLRASLKKLLGGLAIYCRIQLPTTLGLDEYEGVTFGWRQPWKPLSANTTMVLTLNSDSSINQREATKNWRHNLSRFAKYPLVLEKWENPSVKLIRELYAQMETTKAIPTQNSELIINSLLEHFTNSLLVYRCMTTDGQIIAIRGAIIFGNTAYDIFAAANKVARSCYATYGTFWALVQGLAKQEIRYYDLGGVDMKNNPGVFNFKKGTGAKLVENQKELEYSSSKLLCYLVNCYVGIR